MLGSLILIVGLIFAMNAIAGLRDTVSEANAARKQAENVLAELRREMNAAASVPTQATPIDPPNEAETTPIDTAETTAPTTDNASPTIGLDRTFVFRAYEGKIGIFTAEGYLIRTLDTDIRLLPAVDREALENDGIRVMSRKEMDALIEDLQQ